MKRNKVIKVNETTSIEVPAENLTPAQMIRLQTEAILRISEIQLQQTENLSKMVELYCAEQEAKYEQLGIQRLLRNQSNQRRLN